jgi:mono/diheme cytochrome c family protein
MKKHLLFLSIVAIACTIFFQSSCNNTTPVQQATDIQKKESTHGELVLRGKYLVTVSGCNDCHSPKRFTPQGPEIDSAKMLSGHPSTAPLPSIDKNSLKPGNWLLFSADLTAAVGPWGISYSANLTPDSTTGLGAWTEGEFIKTLRTGRHLGQDGGRQILPPMPWTDFAQANDEDLKAIFAYLQALPPISNKVPAPVSPTEVAKLK